MLRAINLRRTYGHRSAPVEALRGVSFEIHQGEKIALLGKSGSGKSTLLNLLGGLDRPTSGTIEIHGKDLAKMSEKELAEHRLTTVGMIFQSFNLITAKTACDNVSLPLIFAGLSKTKRKKQALQALAAVGLGERADHLPTELSGGEQQRVAIARSLVNNPRILLADEPTGNLDSATSNEIIALLESWIHRHQTTLIMVTHDEELATRCTDRILRLQDGYLIDSSVGPPSRGGL